MKGSVMKSAGFAVGLLVALVLGVLLLKMMNKDKRIATKYDEMQEIIRGRAYKYAFWTVIVCEAVLIVIDSVFAAQMPLSTGILQFLVIIIGVMVQVTYCIWHDAYIGLNTNTGRFIICMLLIGGFNLVLAVMAVIDGRMVQDGVLQTPFLNGVCGLLCLAVMAEVIIKNAVTGKEKED